MNYKYKFLKFSGVAEEGYIVRTSADRSNVPGMMNFPSRDVFEIVRTDMGSGPEFALVRMDTKSAIGSSVFFNSQALIYESEFTPKPGFEKYLEETDRMATKSVADLVV